MQIEPIGIFALILGLVSLSASETFSIYVLLALSLLGASAAVTLTAIGGASIQPAHLFLIFSVVLMLRYRPLRFAVVDAVRPNTGTFWFLLALVYALISAFYMPRLFEGTMYTFGNNRVPGLTAILLTPHGPTSGNITQSVYFVGDFLCLAFAVAVARSRDGAFRLANAILFCSLLHIVFALVDLGTYMTGTAELLSVVRNASYRMLDDGEVMGLKRIVGTFPEASAYAYVAIGLFGFSFSAWLHNYRPRYSGALAAALFVILFLSTSTTAYAGLCIYLTLSYLGTLRRFLVGRATRSMSLFIFVAPLAAVLGFIVLAMIPNTQRIIEETVDSMLLNKLSTQSGIERSMWNRQAMSNFFDSYGLGAGIGSIRTSSFVTSVLGNVGLVGAVTLGLFLVTVFLPRREGSGDEDVHKLREIAASSCIAFVVAASISGGSMDLGLTFCITAGLAVATPARWSLLRVSTWSPVAELGPPDLRASQQA